MKKQETGGLSLKTKIGYGFGGYGASMFFSNFCFYALFFFTDVVGLPVLFASLLISLGAVWDGITDPIVGHISDIRDPAKGRRRPFLKWFAVPLAILTWLSFTDPPFGETGTKIFFIIVVLGAYLCQTLIDVPYSSLAAEMSKSYEDSAQLATFRNVFWLVSIVVSSYFLGIVAFCRDTFGGGSDAAGYSYASLICAVPIAISMLVVYRTTKGKENAKAEKITRKFSWKYQVVEPLKNKPFRYVALIYLTSIVAQACLNTTGVYFMAYNLQMSETTIANVLVYAAVIGYVSIVMANAISKKSKKMAWLVCQGCWCVAMILAYFFMFEDVSIVFLIIFGFLYGTGMQTQYQLIWARIPDCIKVDEFIHGERREGIFYGEASMIQKIGAAITIAVLGVVLNSIGYDASAAVQSETTLSGLRFLYGFGVAIPLGISFIFNALDPMNKKRFTALNEAIEKKKRGEEYSTEGFEKLL